jgi:hypothetical protein
MNAGVPDPRYVQRLRALLADYQPQPELPANRVQPQFSAQAAGGLAE